MKRIGALLFTLSLVTQIHAEPLSWKKIEKGARNAKNQLSDDIERAKERNKKEIDVTRRILADAKDEARRVADKVKPAMSRIGHNIEAETQRVYKQSETRVSQTWNEWTKKKDEENAKAAARTELNTKFKRIVGNRVFAAIVNEISAWQDGKTAAPTADKIIEKIDAALKQYNLPTKDLELATNENGKTILHILVEGAEKRRQAVYAAAENDTDAPEFDEAATETESMLINILCPVSAMAAVKDGKNQDGKTPIGFLLAQPDPNWVMIDAIVAASANVDVNAEVNAIKKN